MFNSKHVKQTTFPVNMLNLCSFLNYDCGNQVLEFQSITSNGIIHLSVGESGGYIPPLQWIINYYYSPKWRYIHVSTTFTDTEVNNCLSIYHTSWITSGPKSNFICDNIPTKAILFFFGHSEVNSTWLITSELANQCAYSLVWYILKDYICF